MSLKALPDTVLLKRTEELVRRERATTTEILHHLHEIDLRLLHATLACSSLFDYCTRVLRYSEAQAQRRINAARLLAEFPAIEPRVLSGVLKLSALSQASTFFRKSIKAGKPHSDREKLDILQKLENLSTRATERLLLGLSDPLPLPEEQIRMLQDGYTELKFPVDEECWKKLLRLREIWNMPGASLSELTAKMAEVSLEACDPERKAARAAQRNISPKQRAASPAPQVNSQTSASRYIPAAVRQAVWRRDKGQCTYTEPQFGTSCSARHGLELDHLVPFAKGGQHTVQNLRLRCRLHNQRHAIEEFGRDKMQTFSGRNTRPS